MQGKLFRSKNNHKLGVCLYPIHFLNLMACSREIVYRLTDVASPSARMLLKISYLNYWRKTLEKTNLGGIGEGNKVNLERALPANGRLGGHFVSGHVDACGKVLVFEEQGENLYLQVQVPLELSRYLVDKGSISVNGCSLTVCDVMPDSFAVWLIPHTLQKLILRILKPEIL